MPATLPLYIAYRSPYIFARSTCVHVVSYTHTRAVYRSVHTCVYAYIGYYGGVWVRTLSPAIRSRGLYVKRKHRSDRYRRGSPMPALPLLYGVADFVPRVRSLRESPHREILFPLAFSFFLLLLPFEWIIVRQSSAIVLLQYRRISSAHGRRRSRDHTRKNNASRKPRTTREIAARRVL